MNVQIFDTTACILGEGPIWNSMTQELMWVDIKASKILRRSLEDFEASCISTSKYPTALALTPSGDVLVAHQDEILDLKTQNSLCSIGERSKNRSNDGKVGPDGRFWFGTMDDEEVLDSGALYSWHPQDGLVCHLQNINISNTFAWSPDATIFYFADSKLQKIWKFPFDVNSGKILGIGIGDIKEREVQEQDLQERDVFVSLEGTNCYPDGSAMDADGFLWNAQWGGSRIVRYAPDGTINRIIEIPTSQPTSCCFGGRNLELLFVTSASIGLENEPCAGQTFVVETGSHGIFGHPVSLMNNK